MMRMIPVLIAVTMLAGTAAAAAPIVPIDRAAARDLGDARRHRGPTIIALWSTECLYCKRNLKLFADMQRRSPNLRLITVATEPWSPALAAPLDRLKIRGDRYAYGDDMPEAVAYAIDPQWRGALPHTLFFDGRGGRTAMTGIVDEAAASYALGIAQR